MALQFVLKGIQAFSLSEAEINMYPGSLLHSLITSVESSDRLVIKLDDLPDSMFVTWSPAVTITTELYRKDHIEAVTLSGLFKQHTTAELCNKLQALIDYLLLPGPLTKYLPEWSKVLLPHAHVLDLHYQVAANSAVQSILSSTAVSDPLICRDPGHQRAAVFYLGMVPDGTSLVKVDVFAVAAQLSSWKPSSQGPVTIDYHTQMQLLPEGARKTNLLSQVRATSPIPADHKLLVPMIKAGLQEGLAAPNSEVNSTESRVTVMDVIIEGAYGGSNTPLWVVYW